MSLFHSVSAVELVTTLSWRRITDRKRFFASDAFYVSLADVGDQIWLFVSQVAGFHFDLAIPNNVGVGVFCW